jgi:hypothetical protein
MCDKDPARKLSQVDVVNTTGVAGNGPKMFSGAKNAGDLEILDILRCCMEQTPSIVTLGRFYRSRLDQGSIAD